jgi:CheY-like chemotaxis protein
VHKARKPVVLVVEEQPNARKSLSIALAAAGCGTLEAVTGQRALEILHDEGVDLLVMQMQMPVLDGFDVARILKSQPRFAELPIVFTASQLPRARLAYALQAGAADVLELPVEPKTVQEKVWRILSHWGFEPPAGMALAR